MKPAIPASLPAGYIVGHARGNEGLLRGVPIPELELLPGAPIVFIRSSAVGRIEAMPEAAAPAPPAPARPSRRPRRGG